MPQCSYVFCSSTRNLHGFPKDPDLRAKWTKFCFRQADWVPGPAANICREHFTPESYSTQPNSLKNFLKKDAVPTLRRCVKRQGSSLEAKLRRVPPYSSETAAGGVEYQPQQLLCDQNFEQQPQRTAPMQHQPPAIFDGDVFRDQDYISKEEQVHLCFYINFYKLFFLKKCLKLASLKRKRIPLESSEKSLLK